jgi:hypothetical protein
MKRKSKVVWRKLGREKAWGQANKDPQHPLIEIDPRLGAKRQLEVLCHEQIHNSLPDLDEDETDRVGKELCRMLWSESYRRIMMDKNRQPPKIS